MTERSVVLARPRNLRSWSERLFDKIDKRSDGCWWWTASTRPDGYGQIWSPLNLEGRRSLLLAHRAIWELARGPIPSGLDLDHLCRNRLCVNPEHLEPVTRRINILRGTAPPAVNARITHCGAGPELVACDRRAAGRRCCPCKGHGRHRVAKLAA